MVHRRELDGKSVVFGNQGDLWNNAMTWFDHDTGSVWSQVTGEAILGPMTGRTLELLPSTLTTWDDWQRQFPDTTALDKFTRDTRFTLDQIAVVVSMNDDSVAVPVPDLRQVELVTVEVGGEPVAVHIDGDRWIAYSLLVGDRPAEVDLVDGALVDVETGDEWNARQGLSLGDQPSLEIVPAFSSFPEDYVRFFPAGRVWTLDGTIAAADYTDSRSPTG